MTADEERYVEALHLQIEILTKLLSGYYDPETPS